MRKTTLPVLANMCYLCLVLLVSRAGEKKTATKVSSGGQRALGLIVIKVQGTKVDVLPDVAYVVVDKPSDAAREALKAGATPCQGFGSAVLHGKVQYEFVKADGLGQLAAIKRRAGDVVYTFLAESVKR